MLSRNDRRTGRRARHAVPLVALGAVALLLGSPAPGVSQGTCALRAQPQSGSTGYRSRTARCEGMYVGLQNASRNVQMISLVQGGLQFDTVGPSVLLVAVPHVAGSPVVQVRGTTREANLNWALDATLQGGGTLEWNLGDVLRPEGITSDRIGLMGQAGELYVPVAIRGRSGDSTEVVIRMPSAAAVRWSTPGMATAAPAERLNVDGYFRIMLPPAARAGEQVLTVTWRVRGAGDWEKVPAELRIHRWR
jgi:hypothetical protein